MATPRAEFQAAPEEVDVPVVSVPSWRRTLVRVCLLYTAATLFSSSYGVVAGQTNDTHEHLLLRFGFVVVGIGAFDLYDLLGRRYARAPAWVLGMSAYAVAVAIIMSGMWLYGAAGADLHPDAFRDGFLNFSAVGLAVAAVTALPEKARRRTCRACGEQYARKLPNCPVCKTLPGYHGIEKRSTPPHITAA